jgi:transposase
MGAAIKITWLEHSPTELRAAAASSCDADQARRLLAIALVLEGSSRLNAARQTGMDRQTLRDWVLRYSADGVAGLKSRLPPGRAPALTAQQKAELRELVVKGPDPATDGVVRWRCVDLRAAIVRRFAVEVHVHTVSRWLNQLELTRLQPRPYHPKKDPEAETAYKKSPACLKQFCWARPRQRWKFGSKTRPEWVRKAPTLTFGRREVHAR